MLHAAYFYNLEAVIQITSLLYRIPILTNPDCNLITTWVLPTQNTVL